jgi:hypothetical protein
MFVETKESEPKEYIFFKIIPMKFYDFAFASAIIILNERRHPQSPFFKTYFILGCLSMVSERICETKGLSIPSLCIPISFLLSNILYIQKYIEMVNSYILLIGKQCESIPLKPGQN